MSPTIDPAPPDDPLASAPEAPAAPPISSAAEPRPGTPLFSFGPWLWATLGVLLAVIAALSGVGLVFFFRPSAAATSLVELRQATNFGFLRDLHYWAGQALLIAAWLHLARVFAVGSYRRRLGWRVTVALVVLLTAQTYLGDQLAASPDGEARLAAYAAHVLIVPVTIVLLVALWKRRRSALLIVDTAHGPCTNAPRDPVAAESGAADDLGRDDGGEDGESRHAGGRPGDHSMRTTV